jgi:hypothetical protein
MSGSDANRIVALETLVRAVTDTVGRIEGRVTAIELAIAHLTRDHSLKVAAATAGRPADGKR